MAEAPGIPGQIMHSPTVEKIIQPVEAKGEVAAQHALADSEQARELQRRTVGHIKEAEGGRVEEDQTGNKRRREREEEPGKREGRGREEEEYKPGGQGRHIDLTV